MKLFGKESIEARPLSDFEESRRNDRYNGQRDMLNSLSLQFPGMTIDEQMTVKQEAQPQVYDQQPAGPQHIAMQEMVGGSDEFVQAA